MNIGLIDVDGHRFPNLALKGLQIIIPLWVVTSTGEYKERSDRVGEFDWLDLSQPEHMTFLLTSANNLAAERFKWVEDFKTLQECKRYINELEKHIRILQKTLDLVDKNKTKRRVRCRWQKSKCTIPVNGCSVSRNR